MGRLDEVSCTRNTTGNIGIASSYHKYYDDKNQDIVLYIYICVRRMRSTFECVSATAGVHAFAQCAMCKKMSNDRVIRPMCSKTMWNRSIRICKSPNNNQTGGTRNNNIGIHTTWRLRGNTYYCHMTTISSRQKKKTQFENRGECILLLCEEITWP